MAYCVAVSLNVIALLGGRDLQFLDGQVKNLSLKNSVIRKVIVVLTFFESSIY